MPYSLIPDLVSSFGDSQDVITTLYKLEKKKEKKKNMKHTGVKLILYN